MPFPEKWNMKHKFSFAFGISFIVFHSVGFSSMLCDAAVAQMSNPVPEFKEWVEGLPKDVEMRHPSVDDDIYADPPASKQDKENKKRKVSSPSDPENKKPRKRLVRKTTDASARELSSDSLHRLRDESKVEEEDSNLLARVRSGFELPQVREAVEEVAVEASEPRWVETFRSELGKLTKEIWPTSVLHHEDFLQYREESKYFKVEAWELAKKRDAYKLLSEKSQAELEAARSDQTRRDRATPREVDADKAETEEWNKNMDHLASEKYTARTQLASAEDQLRAAKEKNLARAKMIKGLQSQLGSTVSRQENLAKELEASKSEVITAQHEADKKVS
ncbi:uncharacterized protein [Nicotiana tomentosiformis]|uniref:uncharacterized protein n=1 Tax=Nicotiana tomentosiformis TaxID=4098 RepID=UPI00388CC659